MSKSPYRPLYKVVAQTGPKRAEGGGGFWHELGVVLCDSDGVPKYLSLGSLPINPNWDGFCHLWPNDPSKRRSQRGQGVTLANVGGDDDHEA